MKYDFDSYFIREAGVLYKVNISGGTRKALKS
jgi:hypothetical protein